MSNPPINPGNGAPSINPRKRPSAVLWFSLFVSVTNMSLSVRVMACRHHSKALEVSTVHIRHGRRRRRQASSCRFSSCSGVAFVFDKSSYASSRFNDRPCSDGTLTSPTCRMPRLFSATALPSHNHALSTDADTSNDPSHWKHANLTETIHLPTISVPSHHIHSLLSDGDSPVKQYLATGMEELEGVHPRIKIVMDHTIVESEESMDAHPVDSTNSSRKRILLMSNTANHPPDAHDTNNNLQRMDNDTNDVFTQLCKILPHIPQSNIQQLITIYNARPAPIHTLSIPYQNQSVSRILSKVLPPSAHPPPSSYEQIGHVAHYNLRSNHLPHAKIIGSVLLDRMDTIQTVVNKCGEVGGPYRTYRVELLAGEANYNVHVIEHNTHLYFDLTKVYWCTRLEGERTYMLQSEFRDGQVIADAFCGVGALCIRAALSKGCRIMANDLNPDAVSYCIDSAARNGIDTGTDASRFRVQCGDAREFIMNLGSSVSNLPHHLILNYPLDSSSFLNALRWWPSGDKILVSPRVHVYTFARGDEDRTAAEVAVDMVANGLLPEGGYTEPSKFRGEYLNSMGCDVKAREIRDAAPGKLVICVSFSVTRVLLRRMQGDYGLL